MNRKISVGMAVSIVILAMTVTSVSYTQLEVYKRQSQERMAVALAPEDVDKFIAIATEENLEATPVAKVTEEKRLNMVWNGVSIVNISREFRTPTVRRSTRTSMWSRGPSGSPSGPASPSARR